MTAKKTYMTLFLGGLERGLKFNFGTLRFIGELSGNDPLLMTTTAGAMDQFTQSRIIIHAALLSNYLSMKKQVDFTEAEVIDWVSELSMQQVTEVIQVFTGAFAVGGEASANTQQ